MSRQFELPGAERVFNLHSECGEDPERVLREKRERLEAEAEAKRYAAKCQKTFEQCPGFVGCDVPGGPGQKGRVVVDPALVGEAMDFLKKRFRVSRNIELDAGSGLCLEVITKVRNTPGRSRVRVAFGKPVQYELSLSL